METVKFAILGCGKIGPRHAEKLQLVDGAKLVAVCDIIPERAKAVADKYGCASYTDMNDLFTNPDVDFINICTPSGMHPEHTMLALAAGKNVLCEKPMAIKEEDARKMVALAKEKGKRLYIVKQNRYNPPVKLVSRLIAEGKMGKPIMSVVNMIWNRNDDYYKNDTWRGTLTLDGGTIYTQASHFVDLMLMFMGKVKKLGAEMGTLNHNIEIEDTGALSLGFESGAIGSFNYTTCATKKNFEGSLLLVFSKGTVKIGGEYLNTIDHFAVEGVDSYELEESGASANDYGSYKGSMSNHDKVFADIVREMSSPGAAKNLVSGEEAIHGVAVMEGAIKAAKEGKIVSFS